MSLLALDLAVAAAAILVGLGPASHGSAPHVAAVGVAGVALLVRRRYPLPVLLVVAVCLAAAVVTPVPLVVAVYSVAARHGASVATGIGVLMASVAQIVTLLNQGQHVLVLVVAVVGVMIVVPGLAGLWMFQRAALLAVLRDRVEEAERTRTLLADQAVSAERRHIAREMHDVVAHRVTAIALQAGALSLHARDERTSQVAETIRTTSATALDELRGILRVLRDDVTQDEAPPTRVRTGLLASIEDLVDEVTATGARVELTLPDPLPEVPDQIHRAVYRVVQATPHLVTDS